MDIFGRRQSERIKDIRRPWYERAYDSSGALAAESDLRRLRELNADPSNDPQYGGATDEQKANYEALMGRPWSAFEADLDRSEREARNARLREDDIARGRPPGNYNFSSSPTNSAWKSPAETLQEWKEQRARERRPYDPLISMEGRAQPPGAAPLIRGQPDSPLPPAGLPGQRTRYDPLISAGPGNPAPSPTDPRLDALRKRIDVEGMPALQEAMDNTPPPAYVQQQPSAGGASPFDPPSGLAQGFARPDTSSPAPLIAGPSISDRVRGNRYTNMDPRDREALNLTIAGEIDPKFYGTPEGDQEIANMVSTVRNRSAQTGKSIEDTVKQNQQYSPWNTLPSREKMRESFREHGPDVRRAVANAVTGDVMPTHQGLTSYHADYANPTWARRESEPEAQVGRHIFYSEVDPWNSAGPDLPAAPDFGGIASRDIPGAPPNTPFDPRAPMVGQAAAVSAGTDLPPPADYVAPPPYTGGPVNAPLVTPPALSSGFTPESGMPASPVERMETGLAAPQDPALQQALGPPPPSVGGYDPLSSIRAPLIAPPAGVPQPPLPGPAPMPGVDMGQAPPAGAVQPTPVMTTPFRRNPADVGDRTLKPSGQDLAPAPLIAPPAPVTPRRTVTPQTPVSPEPESNLPPLPPTSVAPVAPVTPGPSAPVQAPSQQWQPFQPMGRYGPNWIGDSTGNSLDRLSEREIEKRARERGFGTVENLTGDRWARGIGAAAGAAAGLATGNPLMAAGLGWQGYKYGDDMRRGYMNRTGPFGLLGNIFGFGRGRDKDKKEKERETIGTPPKKDPSASSLPSSAYGGFGGNRYQGGTYGGQSTGGRYIGEGTGGAFR